MFHRLGSLLVEKLEKRLDKIESQVTNKLDAIIKSIEQLAKNAGAFQRTNNNPRRSSSYNIYHQPTLELEPFTHENKRKAPGVKRAQPY